MERLIPIINKLQDVFATVGSQPIDLPQIAVVGSQSTGKSSVLESLVGRDFLPRGSDIVTRRPLVLQLINTRTGLDMKSSKHRQQESGKGDEKEKSDSVSTGAQAGAAAAADDGGLEWGEFLHKKGERFYDFNEIRKEIQKETDRIAPNKAISYEAINLKICSPKVLNLTLVDLPGMTKVPVANQPIDIEERIKKLIYTYISKPRCLILAISSAVSDLATSDGIQFAKTVDPKGLRTLGVLTKIDLMDQGTNALNVLSGNVIPLQLGYVGVVNRSQKNINDGLPIASALDKESKFFKTHPAYRSISHLCGIPYLARKLNQILINHIKRELPGLRVQIQSNISDLAEELRSYGQPISQQMGSDSNNNRGALLLHLISKFSENFTNAIDGSGVMIINQINKNRTKAKMLMHRQQQGGPGAGRAGGKNSQNQLKQQKEIEKLGLHNNLIENERSLGSSVAKDLFGGARMLYIFRTEFQSELVQIDSFDGLGDDFILNSMRNASGIRSSLFIPEMCFENLVKMQIEKLRKPCINCVEMVYEELKRIGGQCETPEIARFTKFRIALNDCVTTMLKRHLEPCRRFVDQLINIELAYVNTNHPDFISMDDVFSERQGPVPGPNQQNGAQQYPPQYAPPSQHRGQIAHNGQHNRGGRNDAASAGAMSVAQQSHRGNNPNQGGNKGANPFNDGSRRPSQNLRSVPAPMNASNNANGRDGSKHDKDKQGFRLFGFMGSGGGGGGDGKPHPKDAGSQAGAKSKSQSQGKQQSNKNSNNHSNGNSNSSKMNNAASNAQALQLQQQQQMQYMAQQVSHSKQSYHNMVNGRPNVNEVSLGVITNATQREQLELLVIKRFIRSYFEIVKKNIADLVPKSIMFMLVNQSKKRLQQDLALTLYKEDQFEQLLSEDPEIAQKRKSAQELLAILQKALDIINEVRDYKMD